MKFFLGGVGLGEGFNAFNFGAGEDVSAWSIESGGCGVSELGFRGWCRDVPGGPSENKGVDAK